MSKQKPSLARGTRDFGPEETAKRHYIINTIKRNFIKFGFSQIETPAIENLSTLMGKYGEEGDKLLFKILNSGDYLSKTRVEDFEKGSQHLSSKITEKGLRYDLTVPFARFVVMNQGQLTFPFKRFQIQPVWRADRPQKGRYREFYQCDADIIGSKGIWNEIELTLLLLEVYRDLGLEDYEIKINHRELLYKMADHVGLHEKQIEFCTEIDKLDKIGTEQVRQNLYLLGSNSNIDELMKLFGITDHEQIFASLRLIMGDNEGMNQLRDFFNQLSKLTESTDKVILDPSLARGLSYYTGMIFEVKPTTVKMGSINGGGRYDDLTGVFGLNEMSGVGISFGLDRIYDVMEELNLFPFHLCKNVEVLIVHFNRECLEYGQRIVVALRKSNVRAELYPESVKIQKQMNYADKIGADFAIVIGENEMQTEKLTLKDMKKGSQTPLTLEEIIKKLTVNA